MSHPEKSMERYDHYISQIFAVEDEVLRSTHAVMQEAGLRLINVLGQSMNIMPR